MKIVYLDNNATTAVDSKVLDAMMPYFKEEFGNPSSIHLLAREAKNAVKTAREQVANLFGAQNPQEVFFTASGSESANMAIMGVLNANKTKNRIITTKVEHPCVLNVYKMLEKQGYEVFYLDVNSEGELDIEQLKSYMNQQSALVSIMYANNETGVIFPVEEIAQIVKSINPKTKVFVDGVQAAGKLAINVKNTKIDLMSISGHKLHAPKGIGALYVRSGTLINPLIIGGHQERGKRAGTENVPYIAGLGRACELAAENLPYELTKVKYLRDKLESGILKNVYNARLNTGINNRVVNTTNIGFQYIEGELILLHLSDVGICASSGSACTSGSLEPSHVLRAMGVPFAALHGSIRFSLSRFTTEEEIDYVIEKVPPIIEKINGISPFQAELKKLKGLR